MGAILDDCLCASYLANGNHNKTQVNWLLTLLLPAPPGAIFTATGHTLGDNHKVCIQNGNLHRQDFIGFQMMKRLRNRHLENARSPGLIWTRIFWVHLDTKICHNLFWVILTNYIITLAMPCTVTSSMLLIPEANPRSAKGLECEQHSCIHHPLS